MLLHNIWLKDPLSDKHNKNWLSDVYTHTHTHTHSNIQLDYALPDTDNANQSNDAFIDTNALYVINDSHTHTHTHTHRGIQLNNALTEVRQAFL